MTSLSGIQFWNAPTYVLRWIMPKILEKSMGTYIQYKWHSRNWSRVFLLINVRQKTVLMLIKSMNPMGAIYIKAFLISRGLLQGVLFRISIQEILLFFTLFNFYLVFM